MLPITTIENILNNIKKINVVSSAMKNYINSLNKDEYASLATVFIIGRSRWERNYCDTSEYYSFIEKNEANGIQVTQEMLDNHFLSKDIKRNQIETTYYYEMLSSSKVNGVYNHDWLGMKTNLITEVEKGLNMLREIE